MDNRTPTATCWSLWGCGGLWCSRRWKLTFATLAVLIGSACIMFAVYIPPYIDRRIAEAIDDRIILKSNTSEAYAAFQDNHNDDAPSSHLRLFVFNLVNPTEVMRGAKPYFEERGPYWYWPVNYKFDISFHNKSTIRYKEWQYYRFDASRSNGHEDDIITTVNIPFQGVKVATLAGLQELYGAQVLAGGTPIFTTRTVHDILWGYLDPDLQRAHTIDPSVNPWFPGLQTNQTSLAMADNTTGYREFYTGETNPLLMHQLVTWDGSYTLMGCSAPNCVTRDQRVEAWATHDASRVPAASEGAQFHTKIQPGSSLHVFVEQTYRNFTLDNINGTTIQLYDIDLLEFTLRRDGFMNATMNPVNAAYYSFGLDGLVNVSKVEHSTPAFLSKPHFLDCDPSIYNHIDGHIIPVRNDHDTFVYVEPHMGTTFLAYKRVQINMYLEPVHISPANTWFAKMLPAYYPVAWFEQSGSITPELATKFKDRVYAAEHIGRLIRYFGWIIGVILSTIGIAAMARVFCWTPEPEWIAADENFDDHRNLNGGLGGLGGGMNDSYYAAPSHHNSNSSRHAIKESYGAGVEEELPESEILAQYMGHAQPIDASPHPFASSPHGYNHSSGNGYVTDSGAVAVTVGGGHSGDQLVARSQ